jgi:tetratricopeptide (TPR) repeat protein
MPGGKVVVYTGILPVTQDEAGLAVVMGHEIAHAIAEHGGERISQGLLAQVGSLALDQALSRKPEETRQLWMAAFGIGVQVGVLLPYSRTHEREADYLGLVFMAMAGYDPNRAVSFWERMAGKHGGNSTTEFLSTHPSHQTRIAEIRAKLPDVMRYWRPAGNPNRSNPQRLVSNPQRLVETGEALARQGRVPEALAAYSEAATLHGFEISAASWNTLCWFGSLWGYAPEVLETCERAVALAPKDGGIVDSRGLARALTGNVRGAIADFEVFNAWTDDDGLRTERGRWIATLRTGGNPFTPKQLKDLREGR